MIILASRSHDIMQLQAAEHPLTALARKLLPPTLAACLASEYRTLDLSTEKILGLADCAVRRVPDQGVDRRTHLRWVGQRLDRYTTNAPLETAVTTDD